mgnify:CR=1 FL=1
MNATLARHATRNLRMSLQDLWRLPARAGRRLLRHFGVHQFGFDVGVERGAAVVAVFHRELVVEEDDVVHARFAQHGFDLRGAVGVLVNNAGYGQYGPLEEISLEKLRLQFETNVFGGLRLSQLVLPAMRKNGFGRIVNVSSVAGRVSVLGGGAYHASKFAIEALTDALRPEVEPFGIAVVNVLPGPIATHFEATLLHDILDTGPQSPYAYFKQRLAERMHHFLDPKGFGVMSAETVARAVFKAATATRPRTRYNVGFIEGSTLRDQREMLAFLKENGFPTSEYTFFSDSVDELYRQIAVSYTHLTLPTIYSV